MRLTSQPINIYVIDLTLGEKEAEGGRGTGNLFARGMEADSPTRAGEGRAQKPHPCP